MHLNMDKLCCNCTWTFSKLKMLFNFCIIKYATTTKKKTIWKQHIRVACCLYSLCLSVSLSLVFFYYFSWKNVLLRSLEVVSMCVNHISKKGNYYHNLFCIKFVGHTLIMSLCYHDSDSKKLFCKSHLRMSYKSVKQFCINIQYVKIQIILIIIILLLLCSFSNAMLNCII